MLVPKQFDDGATAISTHRATKILKLIDERWHAGNPVSASPQSERYVVPIMVQRFGVSKRTAKALLSDWITNAMVRIEISNSHTKIKGLKVMKWPG